MTLRISVAVVGARGRMGALACGWIRDAGGLLLAAELDLGDDLARAFAASKPQVALDFTSAACARANALAIVAAGVRPVIGTSGLGPAELAEIRAALRAKALGGLVVPNFSIGAVLAMRFAEEAARFLPAAEVIEAHHPQKEDAPSGTARATAERIAAVRGDAPADRSREIVGGVRGGRVEGVPVHSIRLPGVVAHQEVRLGGDGEMLSIRHDTIDRVCFRDGVLLALRSAPTLDDLVIGLEPLLSQRTRTPDRT